MEEADAYGRVRQYPGVFTRALKEGERPIEGEFVSPADGALSQMGGPSTARGFRLKVWTTLYRS